MIIKKTNPDNTKTVIKNDEISNPEDIAVQSGEYNRYERASNT